jgi:cholesterol oxidase
MPLADRFEELEKFVHDEAVVDVVVIGSGYGAGVCAARLAEAGKSVFVLERGREFAVSRKGDVFPTTGNKLLRNVQLDGTPLDGTPVVPPHRLGLYNCYVGTDLHVVVGCGLGGTSLINANVMIEPDPRVFERAVWPREIRADVASGRLGEYFARARNVLRPAQYPSSRTTPRKLAAMERNGGYRALVNVNYDDNPTNGVGVEQPTCTECGDCVTGCNVGAKKTLCYTYLPIAKSFGARIFVQCDVHHLARRDDGTWEVHFQRLQTGAEDVQADKVLRAKTVFLGAGVMGSTAILLRSRDRGLPLAADLGGRVGGNGDAVAFAYDCDERMDSVGFGRRLDPKNPAGATILGVVDQREGAVDDGIIIEEGAFPSGTAAALRKVVLGIASYTGQETGHGVVHLLREWWHQLQDWLGFDTRDGALNRTLLFLLMGHDGADGLIELDHRGRPTVKWPQLKERKVFSAENTLAKHIAARLGGVFVTDPLAKHLLGENYVTVHPLGGCAMGDGDTSPADHAGRVRSDDGGVHSGLYVADGSLVPTSLGANPLWTITALAERVVAHAIVDLNLAPDLASVRASSTLKPGTFINPWAEP